ncbi:putative membrane protein [Propionispora sp. 2/2-37]|nr:putative membrane protein [Propionispora sp. 2/2-37]
MEPDGPADRPEEGGAIYTPGQRVVLQILQWGAWTAAFSAMLYVMHVG